MSRFASALAGALGLVVGWPAVASGEPTATVTVTTEERLVATARAQNRELRVRSADRDVAKAGERTAAAIANPSVRLEWLHAQEGNPFDSGWGVGLSWKPPQPGVWSAQRKEAEANTRAVELETLESAAELEAAVRAGWATCAELGALYEVADRAVATRRSIQELVAERVERGAATRIELSAASLSVTRAEQERDEIGVERESARRRLAALAGLPAGSVVDVPAAARDASAPPAPAPAARLRAEALSRRALLRADDARSTQRAEAARAEEARRWPWISLASAPRFRVNDQGRYPQDLQVAIDVTLPIFDRNTGRIEAAEAERRRQADARAAHVAEIEAEVEIARAEVVRRAEILERYRTIVAPMLREHEALVRDALAGQRLDLTALLAAEELALRTQRQEIEARLAHRRASIRLQRAAGALAGR